MGTQDTPTEPASQRPTIEGIDAALRAAGFDPSVVALYPDKVDISLETLEAVAQWWARRQSQGA